MANRTVVPAEQRFWAKVNKNGSIPEHRPDLGPCWVWTACLSTWGYGWFAVDGRTKVAAHLWLWRHVNGDVPAGFDLDHKCGVRPCVRLDHLHIATRSENAQNRRGATRRSKTGVRGVTFDRERGLYLAQACVGGRAYRAGQFTTLAEAETAATALRNRLMTNNLRDRMTS